MRKVEVETSEWKVEVYSTVHLYTSRGCWAQKEFQLICCVWSGDFLSGLTKPGFFKIIKALNTNLLWRQNLWCSRMNVKMIIDLIFYSLIRQEDTERISQTCSQNSRRQPSPRVWEAKNQSKIVENNCNNVTQFCDAQTPLVDIFQILQVQLSICTGEMLTDGDVILKR